MAASFNAVLSVMTDDAIWWSVSTITTVGYGDKYPITNLGRTFALLWMFIGLAVLSILTGTMSAELSSAAVNGNIQSIHDLKPNDIICTPSPLYATDYLAN